MERLSAMHGSANGIPAGIPPEVLATDLDGTLIPLDGIPQHIGHLREIARELKRHRITLIFVTGRHFDSVLQAIQQFSLPFPDWIICDVGSSIYARRKHSGYQLVEAYHQHQDEIIASLPIDDLQQRLDAIDGLRLQEEEKQGPYKLSFYANAEQLAELTYKVGQVLDQAGAPYSIIHSVDPFNGDGLIDLLPTDVSKAFALDWWIKHEQRSRQQIVFSGDSGNDYAALTAGYRAILVGNADRQLAQRVFKHHRQQQWPDRLFLSKGHATSGVLEGMRWFGLAGSSVPPAESGQGRLGANCLCSNVTSFQVWAPRHQHVDVEITSDNGVSRNRLTAHEDGYFSASLANAPVGAKYRYLLNRTTARPDPVSRFQPEGVHGPSMIVNPDRFPWTDFRWQGIPKRQLIIYELHLGAFTEKGTFLAAIDRIPELIDLGVTAVEIMPVAQSPGRWNWGYDGVNLFAPRNTYGEPDDFRWLVDACHAQGIAVILDVVYNHLGPEGNYLSDFGPYFASEKHTPWGDAFNFDGESSEHVRRLVIENAIYWLDEFHLDGLRLDAVHFMLDDCCPDIMDDIGRAVNKLQESVARKLHLIAEANIYDHDLLSQTEHRPAYDAIWSDCLMHSIYTQALPELKLTHRSYQGGRDLAEALKHGYLYYSDDSQPQRHTPETRARFSPEDRASFVTALQTHDAVGNHPAGKRLHQLTSKAYQRAAAALMLLYPSIPLIFMGEEVAIDAPFPFFVDFEDPQLQQAVEEGRAQEYPQHVWGSSPSPGSIEIFRQTNCQDIEKHDQRMKAWYRDLISLRKQGIGEGWLAFQHMASDYNPEQQVFSLRFRQDRGSHVCILARLSHSPASDIVVPLHGSLLLSSEPETQIEKGQLVLHPDHAVIFRS